MSLLPDLITTRPDQGGTVNPSGQKIFTLIELRLTWMQGRDYCRTHYTDLAMIEKAEENTQGLPTVKSGIGLWIGLHRVPWRWSDRSSPSFTNWAAGEPNNNGGDQFCVVEYSNHYWDDVRCSNKFSFFCQRVLKVKKTRVMMKIQTDADLSDSAFNAQILQQLGAVLMNKTWLTDFNLQWKIQPRKLTKK